MFLTAVGVSCHSAPITSMGQSHDVVAPPEADNAGNDPSGDAQRYRGKVHFYPHDEVVAPSMSSTLSSMALSSTRSMANATQGSISAELSSTRSISNATQGSTVSVLSGGSPQRRGTYPTQAHSMSPSVDSYSIPSSAASLLREQLSAEQPSRSSIPRQSSHQMPASTVSLARSSAALSTPRTSNASLDMESELRCRNAWGPGSVLEVHSASLGRWLSALVTKVSDDRKSVVVQYSDAEANPLMKTLLRSDVQLAILGSNVREPPPGMQAVPSQSRPGEVSYLDPAANVKHPSLEVAWRRYYERLLEKWQASGQCMDLVYQ
eukprot:TRINITY_DN12218_c0_g1_i1.p1 TRINITY_DN12218_c0_g1~~TRINITY_DN12218_c0_g1_i1.p1  ORF type:complete len:321 (+),score=37.66 TRINITY_DN12218_c0_g1_i1:98-1060(+)